MADNSTFQAAAYTSRGTRRDPVSLPETLFDGTVNMPVMHQAVKAFMANQRQGNASTKTRGFVIGGNQKPWKQKGTGRARQGSTRAPHWVGGGTVFGPSPRAYDQYVPKQMRQLARKSALNARARENALFVIDRFDYDAPRTKSMLAMLERLGVADKKVLILTDGVKLNVFLSGRNLPAAHVMPYSDVSTYHVLWSDVVLIEAGALGQTLEPVTEAKEEAPAKAKSAKPAAKAPAAKKESRAAAKTATKTAKKSARAAKKTAKAEKKSAKPAAKKAKAKAKGGAKKKTATKKKGK